MDVKYDGYTLYWLFCVAIVRSSDAGSGSIVPETRFRVYGKMNYVIVGFSLCFGRNFWCFFKMQYGKGRRFSQTLKIGWFKLLCTQIFDFVYSFPHYLEPYRGNGLSLEKLSQFLFFFQVWKSKGATNGSSLWKIWK